MQTTTVIGVGLGVFLTTIWFAVNWSLGCFDPYQPNDCPLNPLEAFELLWLAVRY